MMVIFGKKIGERRLGRFHRATLEAGWSRDIRRPYDIGDRSFLLGFIQFRSRRRQGNRDFVFAQDETVAILKPDHLAATDALLGIVQVYAVGADVGEEIAAILMVNGAVLVGQDFFRVLQNPVALRGAPDTDGTTVEYPCGFLSRRESLVTGDSQFQGHDALSVGRGAASTAPSGIHRIDHCGYYYSVYTDQVIAPSQTMLDWRTQDFDEACNRHECD